MMTINKRNDSPLNVFEDVFGTILNDSVGALAKATQTGSWNPSVDIIESNDSYTLTADLPGLTKGDVHLSIEDGVITLSGERKTERSGNKDLGHRYERAFGKFSRSFQLESGINNNQIKAEFKNGLLKVVLPKAEASKAFEVSISE